MNKPRDATRPLDAGKGDTTSSPLQRVNSVTLFGRSRRELIIAHNGREYRLRLTQRGRLILTA